jgi:hypothetical protein
MNINCEGPCLLHCYKKNSIILLLIGIIIGYYININSKGPCLHCYKKGSIYLH